MDISVVIPVLNEADNMRSLLPELEDVLSGLGCSFEILVIDGGSTDTTRQVAASCGATVISQREKGYGVAVREGIGAARGDFIITMDGDLSHRPAFVARMWEARHRAGLIIGSRYIPEGSAQMPLHRYILSIILNAFFAVGLSIAVKDISSGYRMYNRKIFAEIDIEARDFEVQQELLIKAIARGWRVLEVPFHYRARGRGLSHARLLRFGWRYIVTFVRMWRLRNSVSGADYDERACASRMPQRRYWYRRRHNTVFHLLDNARRVTKVLDVGCGTGRIIMDMPAAYALDINFYKLRYLKRTHRLLVQARGEALPFYAGSFDCVICTEVIAHTREADLLDEVGRVLRPGGILILSTADSGTLMRRVLRLLHGLINADRYTDIQTTRYTCRYLKAILEGRGYDILECRRLLNAHFTLKAQKRGDILCQAG
ncbi:MAG: glycosyltransferase [Candidatus Omnitrophica bacterium]|nr:glycosyltransferase [Candidatus Omnitrophota bacterium]